QRAWTSQMAKASSDKVAALRTKLNQVATELNTSVGELQTEIDRVAQDLRDRAMAAEVQISPVLQQLSQDLTGGDLLNFDFRLKSLDSIRGKLIREAVNNLGRPI